MKKINFSLLIETMRNQEVERPNKASNGTLSGHAAGEPFEKSVYHHLKDQYPNCIFKQYEYLNDLYLKKPKYISVEQKKKLFDSPTALFLLSRSDSATRDWNPQNIFQEKQDDTADILFYSNNFYDIIDVKTRNIGKHSMAPNIISSYKLALMCANMIDNNEFDNISIDYIEIDWKERGNTLLCTEAHHANLFKVHPDELYINWASGMQIQFHVCEVDQSWDKSQKEWAFQYLKTFVGSAKHRCQIMHDKYIKPFLKYID